jgi:hypothetical protein
LIELLRAFEATGVTNPHESQRADRAERLSDRVVDAQKQKIGAL